MKHAFLRLNLALCAAGLLASAGVLRADDVTDQIDEAVKAYNEKDFSTAASALDAAAQMIRQKRAEGFVRFLPEAPAGWMADEPTSSAAGMSMFGGAVTAERHYSKDDSSVDVKLVTDSPMLQGMMMFLNNPMLLSSAENGKLERIKGQKALVKYDKDDKSGSINVVVGGSLLLTVEGNGVSDADLRAFAEAIDYAALSDSL